MFFDFCDGKNGIIKSISIDTSKLDVNVKEYLLESIKKDVKLVDNKIIIKTNMTFEMLKKLNDGYNEFHSQFIVENVINPKEILKLKEEV